MNRLQAMRCITQTITADMIVVCTLGEASSALHSVEDRPRNFYMLGSFGMAISIGLGLSLVRKEKIIVIDGDAAILYNLGSLGTTGWYCRPNLIHIVIDNGVCESTGRQPTATSAGIDLAEVGRACRLPSARAKTVANLRSELMLALKKKGPRLIVADVSYQRDAAGSRLALSGPHLKGRFLAALSPESS
jgi:thiamine pyrophosphate-dependent acetolactate synthase large subunit-like protein